MAHCADLLVYHIKLQQKETNEFVCTLQQNSALIVVPSQDKVIWFNTRYIVSRHLAIFSASLTFAMWLSLHVQGI